MILCFYSFQWIVGNDFVRCYCLSQDSESCAVTVRGYRPHLLVKVRPRKGRTGSGFLDNLKRSLAPSGHEPIDSEDLLMSSTSNISKKSVYTRLYFSSWEARRHCINLLRKSFEAKVYSEDVDDHVIFLTDFELSVTGWFSVDVTQKSLRKYSCFDVSTIRRENIKSLPSPLIASFDIECYSSQHGAMPKSYKKCDKVAMISVVFGKYMEDPQCSYVILNKSYEPQGLDKNQYVVVADDEQHMFFLFSEVIKRHDPDIIAGYNIFGFDFPYMVDRMDLVLKEFPDISRLDEGGATYMKDVDWESSAYGWNVMRKMWTEGRIVMDIMQIFRRRKEFESVKLSEVSIKILKDTKLDMSPSDMFSILKSVTKEGIESVMSYCIKDSQLVLRLINNQDMWTSWVEEAGITMVPIEDLYTRGSGVRITNQLYKECYRTGIAMKKPKNYSYKFEGGHVFEPDASRYENCTSVDFKSLYPSIMIQYNICTSTYIEPGKEVPRDAYHFYINNKVHVFRRSPEGVIPKLLRFLIEERSRVRQQMNESISEVYRSVLDQRQNALKICANAIYGVLGSKESKYLKHFPSGEAVTFIGRSYVTHLKSHIEKHHGISVAYGDTDSSYLYGGSSMTKEELISATKNVVENVNSILPSNIRLAYETHYDVILFLTKKRYILCSGGKITYKGVVSARRGFCNYAKDVYNKVLSMSLRDGLKGEEILRFLQDSYEMILDNKVPIGDLVMTKSVKKEYVSQNVPQKMMMERLKHNGVKISPGTRIEYVFVKAPEAEKQGERMYTTEEVLQQKMEIDGEYYMSRQMSRALGDLTKALGYKNLENIAYILSLIHI
eukprot:TRINITY_DN1176_c0_g1_i8.p1 TRINITY_DN1176_c0_g1~~TRINITY_DN1176_c0_g1_i8.p1  ORF type:complete len:835 (-),score=12.56 TRINITY_DN1176_c0_g1_i8:52-2556(-)